jgi:hypothetical protein
VAIVPHAEPGNQKAVPDGTGGSIICWLDDRNGNGDIYAQRIDATGNQLWKINGVAVCTEPSIQVSPVIVSDGTGGAVIVWQDGRTGGYADHYAQRVNSNGNSLWATDGIPIFTFEAWTQNLVAIPDGYGGTLIAWLDNRNGNWDIFAQRLTPGGVPRWNVDGIAVCTEASDQDGAAIVTDGSGGIIVGWDDDRNTNTDIFAQRVDSSGTVWWGADGNVICDAVGSQTDPEMTADGSGAAIFTWSDTRNVYTDLYAQRINFLGLTPWTANGVLVCGATDWQGKASITPDGANGAIIAWRDNRSGSDYDIYAQRLNSSGTEQWTTDGIAVCSSGLQDDDPAIESDGAGGAIITWSDERNGNRDIFSQRVDASGAFLWAADGVTVCAAQSTQAGHLTIPDDSGGIVACWLDKRTLRDALYAQRIDSSGNALWFEDGVAVAKEQFHLEPSDIIYDDEGGAIICWADKRWDDYDIYVQRIDSLGANRWENMGIRVCALPEDQVGAKMVPDGSGGGIIVWMDSRNGNYDLYAQRLDANGTPLWTANGISVSDNSADQIEPRLVSDDAGGVIVTWYDDRAGGGDFDIYAQRVSSGGSLLWGPSGRVICSASNNQQDCRIVSDGSGGAVIGWLDYRNSYYDIYAQRVNASGTMLWAADGVAVCSNSFHQERIHLAPDGSGGALVTWQDGRNGNDNVFVQRIDSSGSATWTANGAPVIILDWIDQVFPQVARDSSGGAIVVWEDHRNATSAIFAMRIDSTGSKAWGETGLSVSELSGQQQQPQIVSDNTGGVVITWTDYRSGVESDIYASRIGPSGNLEWKIPVAGIPICAAADFQYEPRIAHDGFWGGLIVWADRRGTGEYTDLYAQKIKGAIGVVAPTNLDFGMVPVLGLQYKSFTISNVGDVILSEELNVIGQYYRTINDMTDYTVDAGEDLVVNVRFEPDYEGVHTCVIETGYATSGDVSCTGTGYGPICDIDATDIHVPGLVQTGSYHDTTVSVVNNGGGILNGNVSEICDQFSILSGDGPFSLYQYDTLYVDIRFEPSTAGVHQCTIETGVFSCSDITISGEAFTCPGGNVLFVDADAVGAGDGSSWSDAFVSLQDALTRSTLCGIVDEIWVADGTYYPTDGTARAATFDLLNNLSLYGGFAGTESTLSERDLFVNTSVLSGDIGVAGDDSDNSYRVVTGSGVDSTSVLDGFTITGGNAEASFPTGGGMYLNASSPRIINVKFNDNRATTGGGMYNEAGSAPKMYNVVFFHNYAGDLGGGIYNDSSIPVIVNATFNRNRADGGGAGVFNERGSNTLLTNVIMWDDSTSAMILPEIANHNSSFPVISYSLVMDCGESGPGWESSYGTDGGHNIDVYPRFVNAAQGDLHLAVGSMVVDTGDGTVPGLPATDIDGNPRIQGGDVDMGAYEGEFDAVRVALDTDPSHLEVIVDGDTMTTWFWFYSRSGALHEIGTPTPQVQGQIIYSFTGWSDGGDTTHTVTVPAGEEVTYTASFTWAYTSATIDSIVDVSDDQGGWVRVYFRRSHYDQSGETQLPIERYDLHRRVDNPSLVAAVLADGKPVTSDITVALAGSQKIELRAPSDEIGIGGYLEYDGRYFIYLDDELSGAPPGLWEVVGTVSAQQQVQYIALAPTLADSAATLTYTAYYISAHSTTPAVFFDSPADSGYSVDNIAPGVPQGFAVAYNTGSGNQLGWDPCPESDFQYFKIYRDTDLGFVPGPGNEVHATADVSWSDPDYDGWNVHYKITALDHAGNESPAASPGTATGSEANAIPTSFALYQNVPNPFNPSTAISYDVPPGGGVVTLRLYDVAGRLVRTLVDESQPAGRKTVGWNGASDAGKRVASGIYFYRMTAPGFTETRKMVLLQ